MTTKPKLTIDEHVRRWAAFLVAVLLGTFHGQEAQKTWLWELSPFPCGIPSWENCVMGFMAALLPPPFHASFVNMCLETSYREMDRAHERFKRNYPEEFS